MNEQGGEGILFVLAESVIPAVSAGAIGPLEVGVKNCTDGAEANDCPDFTIGLYVESTFIINGGALPSRGCYQG